MSLQTIEFNDVKSAGSFWTVKDSVTGKSVRISPSPDDGVADSFSKVDVAVRRFYSGEVGTLGLWGL
ncbi:MAG: hypothetical protein R2880_14965 [Deinococcales bacterium]